MANQKPDSVSDPLSPQPPPPPADLPPPASAPAPPSEPATEFHIGDEFSTAKRTLPPARIVLVSVAIIALIVAIVAWLERPKPQGAGAITFVALSEVPNQNMVLAAITLTLKNNADKALWIRSLKAELTTADGHTYEDNAASAVDLDRYFQAFRP